MVQVKGNNMNNTITVKETATVEEKKNQYMCRNDYLKSLPKDEHGNPVVDKMKFLDLAYKYHWEQDFLDDALSAGIIEAEAIPEYFIITEEYGF